MLAIQNTCAEYIDALTQLSQTPGFVMGAVVVETGVTEIRLELEAQDFCVLTVQRDAHPDVTLEVLLRRASKGQRTAFVALDGLPTKIKRVLQDLSEGSVFVSLAGRVGALELPSLTSSIVLIVTKPDVYITSRMDAWIPSVCRL